MREESGQTNRNGSRVRALKQTNPLSVADRVTSRGGRAKQGGEKKKKIDPEKTRDRTVVFIPTCEKKTVAGERVGGG